MMPKLDTLKNIIASTITVGIGTGVLYISGVFYDAGFLETLNIESSLFPKTFEETLFTGGIILFNNYLRVLLIGALLLLLPFFVLSVIWGFKDNRAITFLHKNGSVQPEVSSKTQIELQNLLVKSRNWFAMGVASTLLIFFSVIAISSSYKTGISDAQKAISDQIEETRNHDSKVTFMDESSVQGHIIRCSSIACAIVDKDTSTIFKINDILKIEKSLANISSGKAKK